MTDDYHLEGINYVTMKKCDLSNGLQRWMCVGDKKYRIKQARSDRYLNYGDHTNYVTTNETHFTEWTRRGKTGETKDVCAKGNIVTYTLNINLA